MIFWIVFVVLYLLPLGLATYASCKIWEDTFKKEKSLTLGDCAYLLFNFVIVLFPIVNIFFNIFIAVETEVFKSLGEMTMFSWEEDK